MSTLDFDLNNCDTEPIHIPGQIQSHGFLIVIDDQRKIRFYSENIKEFIPEIADDLSGKSIGYIESLFGQFYQPDFIWELLTSAKSRNGFESINPVPITICGMSFYLIISANAENYMLEFEMAASNYDLNIQSVMGSTISDILTHSKLSELMENAAAQVEQIIDFDRVMIYRFAKDGHGEVVAEAKNRDLLPWLGLHYPASDIPKQARELYKLNLTRLIADVNAIPARIRKASNNTTDLDLTYSQLRAVSPIHIQYLKNMDVASSFSISLKYKNELWGLIACHNYTTRIIDYKSREYAKLIGQILSSALEFRQNEENLINEKEFTIGLDKIIKQLLETESIETALTSGSTTLLDVIKSDGAILVHDKKIFKLGSTPGDLELLDLMLWINDQVKDSFYVTDNFSSINKNAFAYKHIASGILISVLSKELGDYLIWFRAEYLRTVNWAGNPNKTIAIHDDGLLTISPRKSFEVWTESISGISESWKLEEIQSSIRLRDEINYGLNQKASTAKLMNERLRQAYEELETFSYTISHDLKNPIASIKSYAQLLIRDQTILERGQQMLHRIADRADQMNLMINAVLNYSRIGRSAMVFRTIKTGNLIADIVKDLELVYDVIKFKIIIGETPDLKGDPIMMLQVFSNLISNAVKYSQHSDPTIIHIAGKHINDKIHYTIKDNGMGIAKTDLTRIFELFNRMDNVQDIEGSGVGLAIVKRIVEKHEGTIHAESELGIGSTFHLTFNHSN